MKYKFTISFQGQAFEEHSIDVRQLAPAMLSLGKLFEDANNLLNENKTTARLKAIATNPGSFDISFTLDQSIIQAAKDFFSSGIVEAEIIAALLFFDVNARISLSTLLKFLRGKKPDKIVEKGEDVEIACGNHSVVAYKSVINLYYDNRVRKDMEQFVEPLNDEGVESLEIYESETKKQIITKEQKEYFSSEESNEEILTDNEVELVLSIGSIAQPEDYKWKLNDGEKTHYYAIKDKTFNESILKGRKFTLNDKFKCRVRIIQKRNKLTDKITIEREVVEVLKHIEFTQEQQKLNFDTNQTD